MARGVIATQVITTTHRLATTLVAQVASQARGTPIGTTIAIGGGATIKTRVRMQANGMTHGIAATNTTTRARINTPIHRDLAVLQVLKTVVLTLAVVITLQRSPSKEENVHLAW